MITLKDIAALARLKPHELILGVAPQARHRTLLQSYLLNRHHGRAIVLRMIVRDLRGFLDMGARHAAADLLVVLRLFMSARHKAAPAPMLTR